MGGLVHVFDVVAAGMSMPAAVLGRGKKHRTRHVQFLCLETVLYDSFVSGRSKGSKNNVNSKVAKGTLLCLQSC